MNSLINCYFKNNSHTSKLQAFTADRINMTLKCAVTMSNEYQELLISDSSKINLVRNAEKNQGKSRTTAILQNYRPLQLTE